MAELYASAIPVVEPGTAGVHLSWLGPLTCPYAPGGWRIERRNAGRIPVRCERLTVGNKVTSPTERPLEVGTALLAPGPFPGGTPGTVCTIDFATPTSGVHGRIQSGIACLIGYRQGKTVVALGPLSGAFDAGPATLDRLVIHLAATSPDTTVELCTRRYEDSDWNGAILLGERQLPVRELMPGLPNELAEAKSRLLPGEQIDAGRFARIADLLRGLSKGPRGALLARTEEADEYDETSVLDPIRMLYLSPLWRRALGFSLFDKGPGLVPGQAYDYRISAAFPSARRVIGFHTIPSGTQLPADFHLYDCRVRLPAPAVVERADNPASGLLTLTRRGIRLEPGSALPWLGFGIEDYSAVIDLPQPAQTIQFQLVGGHDLKVEAGFAWGTTFSSPIPVPPGSAPTVTLPNPASQLRLRGKGFLAAIIVEPAADVPAQIILPGIVLADTPRPAPPVSATATSLQQPPGSPAPDEVRPRRPLGIRIDWEPAPMASGFPLPAGSPPIFASGFRIERRIEPGGAFEPVMSAGDPVFGNRDAGPEPPQIWPGADLMQAFPEAEEAGDDSAPFNFEDLFLKGDEGDAIVTPPKPGTMLRYRVAALDEIGRASATFTQTDPVRLEKHEPPPTPAGADTRSADQLPDAAPTGVTAKVLVRGGDLTPEEVTLLGDSDNAILLEWGWHPNEREIDPFATQFRIYVASPLDSVPCEVRAATPVPARPGAYVVTADLARWIAVDAAKGQYLEAGYPFFIERHSGGTNIELEVVTRVQQPGGGFRVPAPGPTALPLNYSDRFTRPNGWTERLLPTIPISGDETYRFVLRDRLRLDEDHPRDAIWIGVSAADDQPYVPDNFAGPQPLPGNESAVVGILCQARRQVQPAFDPPPPAGPVARIVAPEPEGAPVSFPLDFGPFLNGLATEPRVFPERVDAADLLSAYAVQGSDIVALSGSGAVPVTIPNPQDREAIRTRLASGDQAGMEDRHLVLLASLHPSPGRLFRPILDGPADTVAFDEVLPSSAARYLYRFRRANSAGQLSAAGQIPPAIVRVPSAVPGATPSKVARQPADPPLSVRVGIADASIGLSLHIFRAPATAVGGQLVRVPNRPDLFPAGHLGLRFDDGTLVAPESIAEADLEPGPGGRSALVEAPPPHDGPLLVWAVSVTADGMPSALAGPWRINVPFAPPALPALTLTASAATVRLDWDWQSLAPVPVFVEQSDDGVNWQRVSPPFQAGRTGHELSRPAAGTLFRLKTGATAGEPVGTP